LGGEALSKKTTRPRCADWGGRRGEIHRRRERPRRRHWGSLGLDREDRNPASSSEGMDLAKKKS